MHYTITLICFLLLFACSSSQVGGEGDKDFFNPTGDEDLPIEDGDLDGEQADIYEAEEFVDLDGLPDGDLDEDYGDSDTETEAEDEIDAVDDDGKDLETEELPVESDISYPNHGVCPLPERRLSQWMLDFPRVVSIPYQTIGQSDDATQYFSSPKQTVLYFPQLDPITFCWPFSYSQGHVPVEREDGEWFTIQSINISGDYCYLLSMYGEREQSFSQLFQTGPEYAHQTKSFVDNQGRIFIYPLLTTMHYASVWDGQQILHLSPSDDSIGSMGLGSEITEFAGKQYYLGSTVYYKEEGPADWFAAIYTLNEDTMLFDLAWQMEDPENNYNPFLSGNVNPVSGEFVAAGYSINVEGILGDPITITRQVVGDVPWIVYKDFESGILWGGKSNVDGPNDSHFQRMLPGSSDWNSVAPLGPIDNIIYNWLPRQIAKNSVTGDIFLLSNSFPYRYNAEQDRFEEIWSHPLAKPPVEIVPSYFRSLVVGEDDQGNFRVHAAGYHTPVMRRTDCHEWEEAFPGSESVRALDDAGRYIWAVGEFPDMLRIEDDGSPIHISGPKPDWVVGQSVIEDNDGLYVVAWSGEGDFLKRGKLYFLPRWAMQKPAENISAADWNEVELPISETYTPYLLVRHRGEIYLQVTNYAFPYYVFRLREGEGELVANLNTRGYLRSHNQQLLYCGAGGLTAIDTENGTLAQILPPLDDDNVYPYITDAVQLNDDRWIASLRGGMLEWSPQTGYMQIAFGNLEIPDIIFSEAYQAMKNTTYEDEYGASPLRIELLPNGEILFAGREGRLALRTTDENFRHPPE